MHDPTYFRLLLHRQSHFYYVLDKPQWDDRLYDVNYNDLKAWEATQKTVPKNSPTLCVGCGCPHCRPNMFNAKEKAIWRAMTATYILEKPPERVKRGPRKAKK